MTTTTGQDTRSKLLQLEQGLNARYAEREDFARGLLLAALSQQHIFVLGPPGAGKTEMIADFTKRISAEVFDIMMMRSTTVDELLGPISLKRLQEEDRIARNTEGMVPRCNVLNLDEVWKGSSAANNGLLRIMSQREYQEGGTSYSVPLLFAVGASNELPTDPSLLAMYSRFQLRYQVGQIRDQRKLKSVLWGTRKPMPDVTLTLQELQDAHQEISQIAFARETQTAMMHVLRDLRDVNIEPDVRKLVALVGKSGSIAQAVAYLDGSDKVLPEHLGFLTDCLWDHPKQYDLVAKTVRSVVLPASQSFDDRVTQAWEEYEILKQTEDTGYSEPKWMELLKNVNSLYKANQKASSAISSKTIQRLEEMRAYLPRTIIRKKTGG